MEKFLLYKLIGINRPNENEEINKDLVTSLAKQLISSLNIKKIIRKKKYFYHAFNIMLAKMLLNNTAFESSYRLNGEKPFADGINWGTMHSTLRKIRKLKAKTAQ